MICTKLRNACDFVNSHWVGVKNYPQQNYKRLKALNCFLLNIWSQKTENCSAASFLKIPKPFAISYEMSALSRYSIEKETNAVPYMSTNDAIFFCCILLFSTISNSCFLCLGHFCYPEAILAHIANFLRSIPLNKNRCLV